MKEQNIKIVAKENNSSATGRKIAFGLTTFELALWVCSAVVVAASYFLSKSEASSSLLSLAASLVGVTALIFVSAGNVIGQMLTTYSACCTVLFRSERSTMGKCLLIY